MHVFIELSKIYFSLSVNYKSYVLAAFIISTISNSLLSLIKLLKNNDIPYKS